MLATVTGYAGYLYARRRRRSSGGRFLFQLLGLFLKHLDSGLVQGKAVRRALVTLDLDFADIRHYPPAAYPGLLVLRVEDQSRPAILRIFQRMVTTLAQEPVAGRLWTVDSAQTRIRGALEGPA